LEAIKVNPTMNWLYQFRENKKYRLLRLIVLFVLPVVLYFIPIDWLEHQHSICLFKNIVGIECWGCGITRALVSAIQFDFLSAWLYNKLIVIVLPFLVYVWGNLIYRDYRFCFH
jgi:hypothetical protein